MLRNRLYVLLRQFLYPSEEDSCKLVRFLVERLSELSGSGVEDMGRVKEDSFESNVGNHRSGDDRLGPKWDEFTLNGEEPEVLNIKGEDASVGCDANHMLRRLDEMSIDSVSSRPDDLHSSEVCSFDIAFQCSFDRGKFSLALFLLDV